MYYDGQGRPSTDGDFEKVDGRLILRNGRSIHYDIMSMDAAPAGRVFLTDAPGAIGRPHKIAASDGAQRVADARRARCARLTTAYRDDRNSAAAGNEPAALRQHDSRAYVFDERRMKADIAAARRRRYAPC